MKQGKNIVKQVRSKDVPLSTDAPSSLELTVVPGKLIQETGT
jgi:hypothetical protein